MARLRLENLRKVFPGRPRPVVALERLDFAVEEGELLVLLGPSGCGKTTTLRLIAGLDQASGGSIRLGEKEIDHLPPQKRPVSLAFQSPALFPQLSVLRNVELGLELRGVRKSERMARAIDMLRLLGAEELRDRLPEELSGGQQQRVSLARALVTSPEIFLLDEPLSNLDARARIELRSVIRKAQRQTGTSMIYVTHDQSEALALADRVVVMNAGRVEQMGTPREIYYRPATRFAAEFVGLPRMNMLAGKIRPGGDATICEIPAIGFTFPLPANLPAGPVLVGIRPEEIRMVSGGGVVCRVIDLAPAYPDTDLTLQAGEEMLVARVRSRNQQPGEEVRIELNPADIHIFSAESGVRLIP